MAGRGRLLLVLCGLIACAESRRGDAPVADAAPDIRDSSYVALDASDAIDATVDALDSIDAAPEAGCPATTSSELVGHELYAAFQAAQRSCANDLQLSTCDDAGFCVPAIQYCGRHDLRLNDQGCAEHYVGNYNFDALSQQISECVVEGMSGACAPCDANTTLTEIESCTD